MTPALSVYDAFGEKVLFNPANMQRSLRRTSPRSPLPERPDSGRSSRHSQDQDTCAAHKESISFTIGHCRGTGQPQTDFVARVFHPGPRDAPSIFSILPVRLEGLGHRAGGTAAAAAESPARAAPVAAHLVRPSESACTPQPAGIGH